MKHSIRFGSHVIDDQRLPYRLLIHMIHDHHDEKNFVRKSQPTVRMFYPHRLLVVTRSEFADI